ncbi:MAG: Dabb family protein [Myxococcota bacterium]
MIERIVLFKLKDEHATEAGRREVAEHSRRVLARLDRVVGLSVGVPADDASEKSWDVSIVVRFRSMDDVRAYLVDPAHRRYVDEYMKPRMEVVKAWNFEVG